MNYPEHEKLLAVNEQSQAIGEFLADSKYTLCEYNVEFGRYLPIHESIPSVLAEWFEIDLEVLESEKRAMLAELRRMNADTTGAVADGDTGAAEPGSGEAG